MFTWMRLKLYLKRKRIASPIFRKLGKLLIRWSEFRKSKFRKPLEKQQSQDILCKAYFLIYWFTSDWHFKEFFLQNKMFEHSDVNIKMFLNPILPVRNIIKFKQTVWKWKFIWLKIMQAEKILQDLRIYIPWDITELKNLSCKFCGRIFIFLICF